MKKSKTMKNFFKSVLGKFAEVKTADGQVFLYDGELEVGTELTIEIENEAGEIDYVAPADGDYELEDGRIITVDDGVVTEIKEKEEKEAPAEDAPAEDAPEEDSPAEETPVEAADEATEEPEKNYYEEIAALRAEIDELKAVIAALQEQVNGLLELPAEEDAFKKQNKEEKTAPKIIFKSSK